jgi:RNA polymerase sigma factor for flagellar operon FliA
MRLSARSRPPLRPKDASSRLAEAYGGGGTSPAAAYGGRRPEAPYGGPDIEACNQLVLAHTGLVKALASRLAQRVPSHIELNELVSVGMMGLVEAARRYEPALGVPFDAFARRRVHGAMVDSLRGMDWAPRSVRRMRRDVDGAISRVRHELNREPTDLEIAQALSVSEPEYHRMLDQIRAVDLAAIRQLESGPEEQSLLDVAFDPEEGPHARLERAEMREHLARAILEIPARERHILSLYYEHELTLAEIGEVIGVGESRVSQLRTQAIARLRSRLRESLQISEVR